ncbi:D-glucuronyl C5-epimerase family protein [Streptomyces longwoodensis]|uniref:D-glucuronyl C5-epimerase family protein n=1 Tax=Streptomyces longwoodensis TaxID=68231 RepID=UPI002E7FDF63|nr:D-glucuronyl C5-epimerase family protein [Streptomyces longwoodensis]WUC56908.1 D-glucuronyl C5-epimerase family protein [Streptomyces longwoodensis]
MTGPRRTDADRRRFLRLAGAGTLGGLAVGSGAGPALAAGIAGPTPKPSPKIPLSQVLSLPHVQPPTTTLGPASEQFTGGRITPANKRIPYTGGTVDPRTATDDVPTTLPFEFNTSGYQVVDVPETLRPWRNRPVPKGDEGAYVDAQGVRMFYNDPDVFINGDGKLYDHPVTQIQYGLGCLASYRTIGDTWFLTRAKAQAQRQIDRRVETRGAWYFPYPFNYTHNEHGGLVYTAPWYSGMAQGEAISLFIQLAQLPETTEAERTRYLAAADGAFASLLRADDAKPWVINKDASGFFWIQEYPIDAPGTSDYTFNGMIFALFGLWDYYQQTRNELALKLWDGGLTTIAAYYPRLRNARWVSYYCNTHRIAPLTYHHHHIDLFMQLQGFSGHYGFARNMDQLLDDYPYPDLVSDDLPSGGTIAFAAGTYTLYQYATTTTGAYDPAKDDAQTATQQVTFTRATTAPASMRRRIKGRGVYYRISAGAYTGWWVGEYYPNVFLRGQWWTKTYLPTRSLTFPANTAVDVFKYGTDGTVGSLKTVQWDHPSNAPFDQRATINGRPMLRISAGTLTGYWVWQGDVTTDGL